MRGRAMARVFSVAAFLAAAGARADFFSVVRITDLRGNAKFQVCTGAERQKLAAELSAEERAFSEVVEKAKDEWNLSHAEAAFPSSRIKPRALKEVGTAMNREEADKLLAQDKVREAREQLKDKEEADGALKTRSVGRGRAARVMIDEKKSQVREDRQRDEVADQAAEIVRKKLSQAVGHEVPSYAPKSEEPPRKGGRRGPK